MSYEAVSGQDVVAIQSKTKGLSAGIHLGFVSYTNDNLHLETEGGTGYGAQLQYGFNHQIAAAFAFQHYSISVSYTHLDVYKRQVYTRRSFFSLPMA